MGKRRMTDEECLAEALEARAIELEDWEDRIAAWAREVSAVRGSVIDAAETFALRARHAVAEMSSVVQSVDLLSMHLR